MRKGLLLLLLLAGCGPQPAAQTVLRNSPPFSALDKVLEVHTLSHLGFGAPISGGRLITVDHLSNGAHAYWKSQDHLRGPLIIMKQDRERDLALYRLKGPINDLKALEVSSEPPRLGEEVYWLTHTQRQTIGLVRGWVVAIEKDRLQLDGWFHPGTSGSPILRANGRVVAIASAGTNWSCSTAWLGWDILVDSDKFECLFRKSFFPAGVVAPRVDDWF